MPTVVHYQDEKKNRIIDKLGRWFRRIKPTKDDIHCVICGAMLFNRNNAKQIVLYCSKVCRGLRHRGLANA